MTHWGWPLAVAVFPVLGLALELLLLRIGWRPYFSAGLPLNLDLVPIPEAPKGTGATASVRWRVTPDGTVLWWANGATGEGLTALHGVVRCYRSHRGVGLVLRWSPPWSPLLAASGLALFGAVRGLPVLTVSLAALMILGLFFVYHQGALRAAAELRWSFVRGGGEEEC